MASKKEKLSSLFGEDEDNVDDYFEEYETSLGHSKRKRLEHPKKTHSVVDITYDNDSDVEMVSEEQERNSRLESEDDLHGGCAKKEENDPRKKNSDSNSKSSDVKFEGFQKASDALKNSESWKSSESQSSLSDFFNKLTEASSKVADTNMKAELETFGKSSGSDSDPSASSKNSDKNKDKNKNSHSKDKNHSNSNSKNHNSKSNHSTTKHNDSLSSTDFSKIDLDSLSDKELMKLEEEIKTSERKRIKSEIGELVVKLLTPAYSENRFSSKDVFKQVARNISHRFVNKEEKEVRLFIRQFLKKNEKITNDTVL